MIIFSKKTIRYERGGKLTLAKPTPKHLEQTWAKYGSPVLLFWSAGTYTNLNFHHELSRGPFFFPLEITNGSDFQISKPQRCKIESKNEVKTFYYGDHIHTWTVIFKKKKRSSPCFQISVRPAALTVSLNLALCVKSLPIPDLEASHLP